MKKEKKAHAWKIMAPARKEISEWAGPKLPVLIVLSFCLVFAVYLGVFQPDIHFQKAAVDGWMMNGSKHAYALEDTILFKLPHAEEMSARAVFFGRGHISSISYASIDQTANVTKILVNGNAACSPCSAGREYAVDADGDVAFEVFAKEAPLVNPSENKLMRRAFFENAIETGIDAEVSIKLAGSWRPVPNSAVPSSFYGVDAPFHIHRVPIGASHLLRLQWPWSSGYAYLSAMPASLIYILLGVSHQYAHKIWVILMFFLPVFAFYLFSRKLTRGKDAVFLFSSLIYLFFPSQGMLVGGGADLFMYGMTARTFAASLSLFSLLFAYEFVVERKNRSFWPALLFFVLAVAAQPRIFMTLCIGMGVLFVLSYLVSDTRRAILLGIACTAAAAFLLAPFALEADQYFVRTAVGGVSPESLGWAVVGFFQLGYFVLPLLFTAGMAMAIKRREMFLLFLFAICALVFVITTSPEINRLAPFLDGLRFMSSFFPLVFFISGAGALFVLEFAIAMAERVGKGMKLDRLDLAVCFCLAVLAPLAMIFASAALTTMDQYRGEASSLVVAAEYSELQDAYSIVDGGCAYIQGRTDVSQYPIYENGFERTILSDFGSPGAIAGGMAKMRCKYLILGNSKQVSSSEDNTRWQEYLGFKDEESLEEIAYGGSNRLFAIKGVEPAAKVESQGARVDGYFFDFDRGSVKGECLMENCTIRVRRDQLPGKLACNNGADGCIASNGDDNAIYVSSIPRGKFSISLEPRHADWLYPLILAGIVVALVCWHFASKLPEKGSKPRGKLL